jgi:hydroxymethylpyrimidine pyrophosphatase-like HAD family hydrolase
MNNSNNAIYVVDFDGTILLRPGDLTKAGFQDLENPAAISAINSFTSEALRIAQSKGVYICICSGNIIQNILSKVKDQDFYPNAISCKVGTELYHRQADNSYILDAAHTAVMGENFNNAEIQTILESFFQSQGILTAPHAEQMNGPGKQSCHVALRENQDFPALQPLQERLESAGFRIKIGKSLITEQHEKEDFEAAGYSSSNVWNFDIVHPDAGKDKVAEAIFKACKADVNVVAGDGGNDAKLMLSSGITKAIVVGNAARDLREAVADLLYVQFSSLPAGLALVEELLSAGHIEFADLSIKMLPEIFQQRLQNILVADEDFRVGEPT